MVFIKDGKVLSNMYGIGEDGKMKEDIVLEKITYITTSFSPWRFDANTDVDISVYMRVTAPKYGNRVITYLDTLDTLMAFFISPEEGPLSSAKKFHIPPSGSVEGVIQKTLYASHTVTVNLEPGEYKAIPYYYIRHQELPVEILRAIGYYPDNNEEAFNLDFLKVPIKIDGQILRVD